MPHIDNLNHRLRTNKEETSKPNLGWVVGLALAASLLGITEAWALESATVTSVVTDATGATITIQGPGQALEFLYNAQSTYTSIPSFTAGTASFRHTFSWPQGTTFACYRTRGTDNLYTDQACGSVTPGSPPTSGTATLIWNASTSSDVADYKVYMGTASGVYGPATSVGNVTTRQIPNLTTGQTYYFSLTAVDASGNESSHSNEVSKSIY